MIFTGHQRSPEATKIDTAYDFPTVFYLHGCAVFYIGQITLFYTKPVFLRPTTPLGVTLPNFLATSVKFVILQSAISRYDYI